MCEDIGYKRIMIYLNKHKQERVLITVLEAGEILEGKAQWVLRNIRNHYKECHFWVHRRKARV